MMARFVPFCRQYGGSMPYRNLLGCAAVAAAFCLVSGGGAWSQDMSKYPDWSGQWKTPTTPLGAFAFGF
jgi:hypothetical protein